MSSQTLGISRPLRASHRRSSYSMTKLGTELGTGAGSPEALSSVNPMSRIVLAVPLRLVPFMVGPSGLFGDRQPAGPGHRHGGRAEGDGPNLYAKLRVAQLVRADIEPVRPRARRGTTHDGQSGAEGPAQTFPAGSRGRAHGRTLPGPALLKGGQEWQHLIPLSDQATERLREAGLRISTTPTAHRRAGATLLRYARYGAARPLPAMRTSGGIEQPVKLDRLSNIAFILCFIPCA